MYGSIRQFLVFALAASALVLTTNAQTVDSNDPLHPVYNASNGRTTYFISSIMTIAEDAGIEVYIVNDGKKKIMPSGIVQMVVYFDVPGRKKTLPDRVTLAFNAGHYQTFQFVTHRDLKVTTEAGTLDLGPMMLTGRKDYGQTVWGVLRYSETLELPVTIGQYRKIIDSKNVSMQIGDRSVSLSDAQLKQLRNLADKHLR